MLSTFPSPTWVLVTLWGLFWLVLWLLKLSDTPPIALETPPCKTKLSTSCNPRSVKVTSTSSDRAWPLTVVVLSTFPSSAACCARDTGFSESEVLLTFPKPISVGVRITSLERGCVLIVVALSTFVSRASWVASEIGRFDVPVFSTFPSPTSSLLIVMFPSVIGWPLIVSPSIDFATFERSIKACDVTSALTSISSLSSLIPAAVVSACLSRASWVAVEIGFSKSLVLSTFSRPTSSFPRTIFPLRS